MVFGNKKDLEGERMVKSLDAAQFAQENECLFCEGSAREGDGVQEAFGKLTQTIIYRIDSGEVP